MASRVPGPLVLRLRLWRLLGPSQLGVEETNERALRSARARGVRYQAREAVRFASRRPLQYDGAALLEEIVEHVHRSVIRCWAGGGGCGGRF